MNQRDACRAWAGRCSLVAALLIASLASCKRQKPNANEDLQKHQQQVLDKMDEIARQIEAERKSKEQKSPEPAAAPPGPEEKKPAAPDAEPKQDAPPADRKPSPGGG